MVTAMNSKTYEDSQFDIFEFSRSQLDFKQIGSKKRDKATLWRYRRAFEHNGNLFVEFILDLLKKTCTKDLPQGWQYNALAVFWSKANDDWLHGYLDPMTALNYSPKVGAEIPDNMIMILREEVIVPDPRRGSTNGLEKDH